ncbi:MAG: nucleoside deaminase, partial [Magnetococcales bacterium]|nr:nucleoside deaminase [Magnetococcales bacterium]
MNGEGSLPPGDAVGLDGTWLPETAARALLSLVVAAEAGAGGEIPVGALLTDVVGRPLAACGNDCVTASDPLGHAELRTVRLAARRVGNYRLGDTALHATLEPCPICRAALVEARVARVTHDATRVADLPEARVATGFSAAPSAEERSDHVLA